MTRFVLATVYFLVCIVFGTSDAYLIKAKSHHRRGQVITYSLSTVRGQPSSDTCWATVATIMMSWRDKVSYTIVAVMKKAGPAYENKFASNDGLSGRGK